MQKQAQNKFTEELFNLFVARTQALNGQIIRERKPWNTEVTQDAIRHFCDGIGDANPLWLNTPRCSAPPIFLASVLYPVIHGAPVEIPLSSLILDLEYRWHQPIIEGDQLKAVARQKDSFERKRGGSRSLCVIAEIEYRNQRNECVAKAESTMLRLAQNSNKSSPAMLVDRTIYEYSTGELEEIGRALLLEADTLKSMDQARFGDDCDIGTELPKLVRGPLTIGDMICWQAAIGPSYRTGPAGYSDSLAAPHSLVRNPVTGWSVKNSQEHEDFLLASHRGMPAPFDNALMRFASVSPLLTNWMGKQGFLRRLSIQVLAPNLYGDTTWYRGTITEKTRDTESSDSKGFIFHVAITGINQLGETTTVGEAEVFLPAKPLSNTPATANKTQKPDDKIKDQHLHAFVEQVLHNNPNKIALVSGGHRVSGATLLRRINELAERFMTHSVNPKSIIGVCIDRSSADMIACLAAILKIGGAYLPIDPELPQKRIHEIIKDTELAVIVAHKCHLSKLTKDEQANDFLQIILADENAENDGNTQEPGNFAGTDVLSSTHPAYMLYTSGITAQPKGVLVPHSSLSVYIQSLSRALPVNAEDIYLQTAALSFSAASRQVWLPLYLGATLVVATKEQATDPIALFTIIKQQNVTVWDTVPSILSMVIRSLQKLDASTRTELLDNNLQLVMLTGEPLSWETVHAWHNTLGQKHTNIINLYSQTETAGTVCFYPVPKSTNQQGIVPLGTPIDNTKVLILDKELNSASEGEIYVSGPRLALGYRGQRALTAERFVVPKSGALAGIPLYKTQDRGRWRSDGVLEHLGRIDKQIKIHGHRIAPTEIELAILTDSNIKETVVDTTKDRAGENILVAWVALVNPASELMTEAALPDQSRITEASIRQALGATLPAYMIPSRFYFVEAIPRTHTGKIDRQSLVSSTRTKNQQLSNTAKDKLATVDAETDKTLENKLFNIWKELLEQDQLNLHDDFFELGGDSLKAGELLASIRGTFGVSVSLRDFFRQPTIAGLYKIINNRDDSKDAPEQSQENLQDKLRKLADGL